MSEQAAREAFPPPQPFPRLDPPPPAGDARPIEAFEQELAAFLGGGRIAIACADRDAALALAFDAIELRGEALVPALGGEAAAHALLRGGRRAVPVDVDPETANLAARAAVAAIGEHSRALVVTHAFGHPAAMPDLLRIAHGSDLAVVEDITEALGAAFAGQPTGTLGHVAALGFGPGHLLTAGGTPGGAVLVADAEVAARVQRIREQRGLGAATSGVRVALAELRNAAELLRQRRQAAWQLSSELRGVRGLALLPHGRSVRHAYDRYVVRLRSLLWQPTFEESVDAIRAQGVPSAPATGAPLHEHPAVREALGADDPRLAAERFATASQLPRELIAIPLDGAATTSDVIRVAAVLRGIAARAIARDGVERPGVR